jgi:hypothetical protein
LPLPLQGGRFDERAGCRQEPPERQHTLVKRKSAISFKTIDDSLLDEAMAEVSALQPKVDLEDRATSTSWRMGFEGEVNCRIFCLRVSRI